jgi:hypothetical protein
VVTRESFDGEWLLLLLLLLFCCFLKENAKLLRIDPEPLVAVVAGLLRRNVKWSNFFLLVVGDKASSSRRSYSVEPSLST